MDSLMLVLLIALYLVAAVLAWNLSPDPCPRPEVTRRLALVEADRVADEEPTLFVG